MYTFTNAQIDDILKNWKCLTMMIGFYANILGLINPIK